MINLLTRGSALVGSGRPRITACFAVSLDAIGRVLAAHEVTAAAAMAATTARCKGRITSELLDWLRLRERSRILTPLHHRLTAEKARESASTRSDRTPVFD
jgi:hypothetical protein